MRHLKNTYRCIIKYRQILILFVLVISCNSVEPVENLEDNLKLVDAINVNNWNNSQFDYDSVYIGKSDTLVMSVNYSGGCEKHNFTLVVSTGFDKSNPVQTKALLSHNSNNDMCEAYITEQIKVSLKSLRDVYVNRYGSPGTIILKLENYKNDIAYTFN